MNRKNYYILLAATAVCASVFALFADSGAMLLSLLRFPFGPIGDGLRWLSLTGMTGNLLAWVIYIWLCCIPAVIWYKSPRGREDLPMLLLCPVTALVLYKCINPYGSFLASYAGKEMLQAQYGGVVYVLLLAWLVLRTVRAFRNADEQALYKYMGFFLKLLGVLFVVSAFGGSFGELMGSVESVKAANQNSGSLTMTYVFLTLQCITDALPALLNTVTIVLALDLLDSFANGDEEIVSHANALAKWCGTTLTVTAVTAAGFHVLQMLCMASLRNVDLSVSIPVGSLTFLLVCLMAARIIAENKALKDDNDLFI